MSHWTLLQVIFDLFVFATLLIMWWRLRRPPQDDPRLSRGLQLLQTKITVLEDLSDRTDAQVRQLTSMIDQKTRLLQNKVLEAEQQILKLEHNAGSVSAGAAAEPEISHHDIVERQRTIEYVKAARMANSGLSIDKIAEQVLLPREELELIVKFNRDQLMFDENQLPDWATSNQSSHQLRKMDFVADLDRPRPDLSQMVKIEDEFKKAVEEKKKAETAPINPAILESKVAESIRASLSNKVESMQPAVMAVKATAQTLKDKLVSTAEDMLRTQEAAGVNANTEPQATAAPPAPSATPPAKTPNPATRLNLPPPSVRKVVFPRIQK